MARTISGLETQLDAEQSLATANQSENMCNKQHLTSNLAISFIYGGKYLIRFSGMGKIESNFYIRINGLWKS